MDHPSHLRPKLAGIWLPLVTPFRDGELDETSLKRLATHLAQTPLDGFILAATTGEALTLDDAETARLVDVVAGATGASRPIYLGLSGSDTRRMIRRLAATADWPIAGYLIACPYYSRPSQDGLYRHFAALAGSTARPIILYNIPYRTGVSLANETLFRLAELPNIVGLKDCCADMMQGFDLLRGRPSGLSVLTGEDALFYNAIAQGADGGILASAHVDPAAFGAVRDLLIAGNRTEALARWSRLVDVVRLLFAEPSPAPIKHWLWRASVIASPELRLPMTGISSGLGERLDRMRAGGALAAA